MELIRTLGKTDLIPCIQGSGKAIIKIRTGISERNEGDIAKISKTKRWFLEKISKTDKPLARLGFPWWLRQ